MASWLLVNLRLGGLSLVQAGRQDGMQRPLEGSTFTCQWRKGRSATEAPLDMPPIVSDVDDDEYDGGSRQWGSALSSLQGCINAVH